MVGYTLYSQSLCPHCGYPRSICRTQERFNARQEYCFAKAAVERAEDPEKKDEKLGLLYVPEYQAPVEL